MKVHALFDGIPYDGSIVNMGVKNPDGSVCYIIGVLKAIRNKLNKHDGDRKENMVCCKGEQDWPGTAGTVKVAACDTLPPMSYRGPGGKLVGFDIEIILRMAKELDVRVEFKGMEFSAVLPSVESGMARWERDQLLCLPSERKSLIL